MLTVRKLFASGKCKIVVCMRRKANEI